jgi:hypothetical protein
VQRRQLFEAVELVFYGVVDQYRFDKALAAVNDAMAGEVRWRRFVQQLFEAPPPIITLGKVAAGDDAVVSVEQAQLQRRRASVYDQD